MTAVALVRDPDGSIALAADSLDWSPTAGTSFVQKLRRVTDVVFVVTGIGGVSSDDPSRPEVFSVDELWSAGLAEELRRQPAPAKLRERLGPTIRTVEGHLEAMARRMRGGDPDEYAATFADRPCTEIVMLGTTKRVRLVEHVMFGITSGGEARHRWVPAVPKLFLSCPDPGEARARFERGPRESKELAAARFVAEAAAESPRDVGGRTWLATMTGTVLSGPDAFVLEGGELVRA